MSSFCKSHFFSKNITEAAIFGDQSFNDRLINDIVSFDNDIVSFEQLGPDYPIYLEIRS